ncbi:hypothetical protein Lpp120_0164 [Lacticaseibacillus paracasei subsp. paracasei Lpp120]|nr:hypothetical protein Lpp120_0164 [Lacticaseibacillus paracasei subsp. paracasei Lpp120]
MGINDYEAACFLVYLLDQVEGDLWSNVEKDLGRLSYEDALDQGETPTDREGDQDCWASVATYENLAINMKKSILWIKCFFNDWINSINIGKAKANSRIEALFGDDSYFLTFNYTKTLEEIYRIPSNKVCHIHGDLKTRMFFGHGDDTDYTNVYQEFATGAEDVLASIDRELRKNTSEAYKKHEDFFHTLTLKESKIESIYFFGFSFSEVDQYYLQRLFGSLPTFTLKVFFNDYDDKIKIEKYKDVLKKLGFEGQFECYHI